MKNATDNLSFYDYHPEPLDYYKEILLGLNKPQPSLSPKFFYDKRGSELFDAICESPEYYVTRTEIGILKENIEEISQLITSDCLLIEPGSGSSEKVTILLDAVRPKAYMPMDISKEYLKASAARIANIYKWLEVHAACVDYTTSIEFPAELKEINKVAFFPGSTIGNFEPDEAIMFLKRIGDLVDYNGGLLIGVDLKKDTDVLNKAYNDASGFTADFNLNVLNHINRELDADFDLTQFRHHAKYNEEYGRIEMYLISKTNQQVSVKDNLFEFMEGDSLHTEYSYKYSVEEFQQLAAEAGYRAEKCWTDAGKLFSVHYLRKINTV